MVERHVNFENVCTVILKAAAYLINNIMKSFMSILFHENAQHASGKKNMFLTMIYCEQEAGGDFYGKVRRKVTGNQISEALFALGAEIL